MTCSPEIVTNLGQKRNKGFPDGSLEEICLKFPPSFLTRLVSFAILSNPRYLRLG